jgi:hypothetical protein
MSKIILNGTLLPLGFFSVKSMYADFMNGKTDFLKIIFVEDTGLTKDKDFYVIPLQ